MKILIVSQYFWPENFKINNLSHDLSLLGHDVTVLTGKPNYPEGYVYPNYINSPDTFSLYGNVRVIRVPMIARGGGGFVRLALNYLSFALSASLVGGIKLRRYRPDVMFVFQPSPITIGLPAAFLRWIKKVPVIFWVQDVWPETLKALGIMNSHLILRLLGKFVAWVYKHCDVILVQSRGFIPEINKYLDVDKPVIYFPNSSDVLPSIKGIDSPKISKNGKSFDIVFAGNIGVAQDFPVILEAAEILRSNSLIKWHIVGNGRMYDLVTKEIVSRGLENCFYMWGRHPEDMMPSFFGQANALLVSLQDKPIFSLTIPSKLQSYLSAGRPILAMLNGEGAKIVIESGSGLVCSAGNSSQLASIVMEMSNMDEINREAMGRSGFEYSKREFNRDKLVATLDDILFKAKTNFYSQR